MSAYRFKLILMLAAPTALLLAMAPLAQRPVEAGGNPTAMVITPPELREGSWLNSKSPLTLAGRRGQVTVLHFWTFG